MNTGVNRQAEGRHSARQTNPQSVNLGNLGGIRRRRTSFAITRLTVGRFFPLKHHSAHLQNSRIIWHVAAVACVCVKHMRLFSFVWRQIALFPKWRPDLYGRDMMVICRGGTEWRYMQARIQDFLKGGGETFTSTPPWTLSAWRHPPSGKLKNTPTLAHSQAPPI